MVVTLKAALIVRHGRLPFHVPARLADGLGLESSPGPLGTVCPGILHSRIRIHWVPPLPAYWIIAGTRLLQGF